MLLTPGLDMMRWGGGVVVRWGGGQKQALIWRSLEVCAAAVRVAQEGGAAWPAGHWKRKLSI